MNVVFLSHRRTHSFDTILSIGFMYKIVNPLSVVGMNTGLKTDKADAFPTKEFFIDMLTTDVNLDDAIVDLVDNCVDGANRTAEGPSDYSDFWVKIKLSENEFNISDNCGGIDIKLAKNYAFRFGRPSKADLLEWSIGNYGIGMKRALFKIGNRFEVDSTTEKSHFNIDIDVNKWKENEKDWTFKMTDIDNARHDPDEIGTRIKVTELRKGVSQDFAQSGWIKGLMDETRARHGLNLDKGLEIVVNEMPLTSTPIVLHRFSRTLIPAHRTLSFKAESGKKVNVRIFAGTSKSYPPDAGWYIYCNGRLILRADQSPITGWSGLSEPAMPKYHNQYAMYRGYAFFESDDPSLLPWNTSKTSIDEGNEFYRVSKLQITEMMRPVIDFLNEYDRENDSAADQRPLHKLIDKATLVDIADLRLSRDFRYQKKKIKLRGQTTIRYSRPTEKVDRVMKVLGTDDPREVGEKTFDRFYKEECEE